MLDGWYCRSLANEQARQNETDPNVDINDSSGSEESQDNDQEEDTPNNTVDYRTQYRYLKRKLKYIIYENEFFQDALRSNQRRLLKVSRDRAFLLDRLLQYEKPENSSSESDATESSEDEATKEAKRRKLEQNAGNVSTSNGATAPAGSNVGSGATRGRKKKVPIVTPVITEKPANELQPLEAPVQEQNFTLQEEQSMGHMTAAEVERHLQSKQPVIELMPERASATVPTEMFSNEPSLDSESNDHYMGSSPTHVAAEECVPMEYSN